MLENWAVVNFIHIKFCSATHYELKPHCSFERVIPPLHNIAPDIRLLLYHYSLTCVDGFASSLRRLTNNTIIKHIDYAEGLHMSKTIV